MADAAYGLSPLVVLNTLLFIAFAASFFHPKTGRDWRAMGAYSAFLVALFTEMYGTPLTIYLLGSWLGSRFPLLKDTHASGHLWNDLIGWKYAPLSPFHLASYVAIGAGFWLIAAAWRVLHEAARHAPRPDNPTESGEPFEPFTHHLRRIGALGLVLLSVLGVLAVVFPPGIGATPWRASRSPSRPGCTGGCSPWRTGSVCPASCGAPGSCSRC
ncbi:hypothetical protein [Streptomyces sp. NPDC058755]|uniref:hypothetical protein n=1 Tax=Streptomyces sp. NPDC058755 TaxID=3346624 RepID=UPI00368852B0